MSTRLVIVAHPDDEVLGCGGTIAKFSQNSDTYTLILGEGITSRDILEEQKKEKVEQLRNDAERANEILGVKKVFFEIFPDNKFDTTSLLDIIKTIERYVQEIKPEVIYTHHRGDLNIDHRITFDAVLTACRPVGVNPVKKILSFEVPSSTEWNVQVASTSFTPNVFENVSKTIGIKLEAMSAYKTEVRLPPHPRSIEKIKAIAEARGGAAGMDYAEAFMLIRELRT
jgi:LmbE family N-acetylglucosaminyl deacetylase